MAIDYNKFVEVESHEVWDAYLHKKGHPPGINDMYHNAWRRLVERWTHRDILNDINQMPSQDGNIGGDLGPGETDNSNSGTSNKPVPNPDTPKDPIPNLEPIGIRGTQFITGNNIFRPQESSAFTLFYEFLQGHDISEFLNLQRHLKRNLLRVAGMLSWDDTQSFNPATWGDGYYIALDLFFDYISKQGFRVEFMALCSADVIYKDNVPALKDHFKKVMRVMERHADIHLLEIANEPYQNLPRDVNPQEFYSLVSANILYTPGAGQFAETPYLPHGSYMVEHSPRDEDWDRKGKSTFDLQFQPIDGFPKFIGPVIQNEPMGAAEERIGGRRDNNPEHFYDYAADTSLFGGACIHSESGLRCRIPKGKELECMEAFAAGQDDIPLEALGYQYYKVMGPNPLVNPDTDQLRMHGVVSNDKTKAIMVAVRPLVNNWVPLSHPDWQVVSTKGLTPQRQNVVFLERK